jgi:hypothetical protein
VISSVLMSDILINVLLQTNALVGPLHIILPNVSACLRQHGNPQQDK